MSTRLENNLTTTAVPNSVIATDDTLVADDLARTYVAQVGEFIPISNNSVDVDNDIDINPASAVDDTLEEIVNVTSTITKQIDAAWTEGTDQGGLDTGTVAADSFYHVHLISKDSDGTIDALFSLSKNAPTVPAGWTRRKRLGIIATDNLSSIKPFRQTDNYFEYMEQEVNYNGAAAGNNDVTVDITLSLPDDIIMVAQHTFTMRCIDSQANWFSTRQFGDPEHADAIGGQQIMYHPTLSGTDSGGSPRNIDTYVNYVNNIILENENRITLHWSNTDDTGSQSANIVRVTTLGWEDMEL